MEPKSRVLPVIALVIATTNFLLVLDIAWTLVHSGNEFLSLLVGGFVLYLSFVTAQMVGAASGDESP